MIKIILNEQKNLSSSFVKFDQQIRQEANKVVNFLTDFVNKLNRNNRISNDEVLKTEDQYLRKHVEFITNLLKSLKQLASDGIKPYFYLNETDRAEVLSYSKQGLNTIHNMLMKVKSILNVEQGPLVDLIHMVRQAPEQLARYDRSLIKNNIKRSKKGLKDIISPEDKQFVEDMLDKYFLIDLMVSFSDVSGLEKAKAYMLQADWIKDDPYKAAKFLYPRYKKVLDTPYKYFGFDNPEDFEAKRESDSRFDKNVKDHLKMFQKKYKEFYEVAKHPVGLTPKRLKDRLGNSNYTPGKTFSDEEKEKIARQYRQDIEKLFPGHFSN